MAKKQEIDFTKGAITIAMNLGGNSVAIGTVNEQNQIIWNDNLTLDMCKEYLQLQYDQSRQK